MNIMQEYQISIWEDIPITNEIKGDNNQEVLFRQDYFDEKLIAIIGANDIEGAQFAHEPKIVRNVNGTNILTFSMFYKYYDYETGKMIDNPYIQYLTNERKIKLKKKNKWYDLVIKQVKESSDKKSCTYTCKDLYINELSKNGYNLEFDIELENNQGTAIELAERVLQGTDWIVGENNDVPRQYFEEPVYIAKLTSDIVVTSMLQKDSNGNAITDIIYGQNDKTDGFQEKIIYIFYSSFENQDKRLQFIYDINYNASENGYPKDDNNVILTDDNLYIEVDHYNEFGLPILKGETGSFIVACDNNGITINEEGYKGLVLSNQYRGKKLVHSPKVAYDRAIGRAVNIYRHKTTGEEIYGYEDTEYITSQTIKNIVANSSNFTSTNGWKIVENGSEGKLEIDWDTSVEKCKMIWTQKGSNSYLFNTGFGANKKQIKSLQKGEKYICMITGPDLKNQTTTIAQYTILENGSYSPIINSSLFTFSDFTNSSNYLAYPESWSDYDKRNTYFAIAECTRSMTYAQLLDQKIGIFIKSNLTNTSKIHMYGIQIFKAVQNDDKTKWIIPEAVPEAIAKKRYNYYYYDPNAASEDDIEFIYRANEPNSNYELVYDNDYSQVHAITAKESNRFNIIQDICESFECLARFDIEHDNSGKIIGDWILEPTKDLIPNSGKKYLIEYDQLANFGSSGTRYPIFSSFINSSLDHFYSGGLNYWKWVLRTKPINQIYSLKKDLNNKVINFNYFRKMDGTYISIQGDSYPKPYTLYFGDYLIEKEAQTLVTTGFYDIGTAENVVNALYRKDFPDFTNEKYDLIQLSDVINTNQIITLNGIKYYVINGADLINFDYKTTYYEYTWKQKKQVTFHQYIGKEQYAGFKYGINLKTIERNIDSDAIVSKIIIKDNSNEHAKDGYCSIVRAHENITRENILYDFRYYINQGLLNNQAVNVDLYGPNGVYTKLKNNNKNKISMIDRYSQLAILITQAEADYQTYEAAEISSSEKLVEARANFKAAHGKAYSDNDDYSGDEYIKLRSNYIVPIKIHSENQKKYKALFEQTKKDLVELQTEFKELVLKLERMKNTSATIIQDFFNRYGRFIQEGSWIDEEYIDDDLYYYDGTNVLATSAMPKISYTFNAIDVSILSGYEEYEIDLGDKTYVEDTEFFGWKEDGITPYHEEVIISEITEFLRQPDKNQIKIQNYKTQFEDLFQRIAAATQSLEFHEGEYAKVANTFTPQGEISARALQKSMDAANLVLSNAKDQSVVWGEQGIIITSLTDSLNILRLVNNGIILSNDGGDTWNTAITGEGINATYISTGQLDADKVRIMNGEEIAFGWNKDGLTAYSYNDDETLNFSSYVRFNKFGIYGYKGEMNSTFISLDQVISSTKFSITWDGIRINRWNSSENVYEPVFYTDNDGNLTLTGTIFANAGKIAGWEIQSNQLYKDQDHYFISNGGLKWGSNFSVSYDGELKCSNADVTGKIKATEGQIGGWDIYKTYLKYASNDNAFSIRPTNIGGSTNDDDGRVMTVWMKGKGAVFYIRGDGYVHMSSGHIGGDVTIDKTLTIADGSIGESKLANEAVTTTKIKGGAITTDKIQAKAITADQIATYTITADQIAGQTITAAEIATSAIIARCIATDAVTADKISVNDLSALEATIGSWSINKHWFGYWGDKTHIIMSGPEDKNNANAWLRMGDHSGSQIIERFVLTKSGEIKIMGDGSSCITINGSGFRIANSFVNLPTSYCYFSANQIMFNKSFQFIRTGSTSEPALKCTTSGGELRGSWTKYGSSISTSSDIRLKKNIQNIPEEYELFFDKITPRIFNFNKSVPDIDHSLYYFGFIAQNIEEELKNIHREEKNSFIIKNEENGILSLCYEEFISLNTWQIQKLKKRVSDLEFEMQQLKTLIK